MCQELQIFAFVYTSVFGCRLSLFRLCDSDFGITPVDDITIGITCTVFCFHIEHILLLLLLLLLRNEREGRGGTRGKGGGKTV
jgi:hypothetical protein